MLTLAPLQRALQDIYRLGGVDAVDRYVRPLDTASPHAPRREVVLVRARRRRAEIAVMLDPAITQALEGRTVPGLSRFHAWCLALEGVSHFVLLAFRVANDRPVSQLELEIQAEIDKYVVGVLQHAVGQGGTRAAEHSRRMRRALFASPRFLDGRDTVRGQRYRDAHRTAARYAAHLERRYVRHGRLDAMVEELRAFYRAGLGDKRAIASDQP